MPPLSFTAVQRLEATAPPVATPQRAASDPPAVRASLIAARVLRPATPGVEALRPGVFAIDGTGIHEAARTIITSQLGPGRLAAVVEQADPRVASRLREIVSARGVQLEAA